MNLEPNVQYINIENIIPNRFQPRLTFDEQALNELAMSIKEHGIIQPLVLRKLNDNKYEIIAGERRYKASQIAGLNKVAAIVADLDDNKSAEVALVENLQRRNLSAIEEAKSYKKLLDRGYLTQDQLAKRLGISQSSVANKIRLLNLSEEVQNALMNEKISERHARSLLQINDKQNQVNLLNEILDTRMTVRQLDEKIKKILNDDDNEELEKIKEKIETFEFIPTQNEEEEIANAILESKEKIKNKYELSSIPTAEEIKTTTNETKVKTTDLNTIIKKIKELEKEIKNSGFIIETEDYDFEDLYQIIIKIEK